jgi:hypothetical protein
MGLEQTGEEVIKEALDKIDAVRGEIDEVARAMNDLGMSAGGKLLETYLDISGALREARRGLRMIDALNEQEKG